LDDERRRIVPSCEHFCLALLWFRIEGKRRTTHRAPGNGSSRVVIQFGMNRIIPSIVSIVLLAAALSACTERPQRRMSEDSQARSSETWDGQLRDRTRHQGEADRMNY